MKSCLFPWPLALGSFLALSACSGAAGPAGGVPPAATASVPQVSSGQPPRNQCDAQAAQFLVGQAYGADTLAQARTAAGADEARMLRPDSMVTKEYKVGRLNVEVDPDNRVVRVYCG